jgi:regulator of RNase E activity RraA
MSSIPEFDESILARFRDATTGLITDAAGRLGIRTWMEGIVPMAPGQRICGRVRPIRYGSRSGMKRPAVSIYAMLRSFSPGDVPVLAGMGTHAFILGENIAHEAMFAGLGGIVADGRVRDVAEIRELPFPVFATGVSVHPFHAELEIVECDVLVECAGAQVRPGDLIVGDADGAAVVPHEAAAAFAEEIDDLAALEEEQEKALRARVPLEELQKIIARKKQRKGTPLNSARSIG